MKKKKKKKSKSIRLWNSVLAFTSQELKGNCLIVPSSCRNAWQLQKKNDDYYSSSLEKGQTSQRATIFLNPMLHFPLILMVSSVVLRHSKVTLKYHFMEVEMARCTLMHTCSELSWIPC